MKLTESNIRLVRELTRDDITYAYFVCMKSGRVSDSREFINYDDTGKTVSDYYDEERLPKSVQNFMLKSIRILENDGGIFKSYIYVKRK